MFYLTIACQLTDGTVSERKFAKIICILLDFALILAIVNAKM